MANGKSISKSLAAVHTGLTDLGNIRDVKVERIGKITIYKRGDVYYLYYRDGGHTRRPKVDGNLAVARATAAKVSAALAESRPSPLGFQRTSPEEMVRGLPKRPSPALRFRPAAAQP